MCCSLPPRRRCYLGWALCWCCSPCSSHPSAQLGTQANSQTRTQTTNCRSKQYCPQCRAELAAHQSVMRNSSWWVSSKYSLNVEVSTDGLRVTRGWTRRVFLRCRALMPGVCACRCHCALSRPYFDSGPHSGTICGCRCQHKSCTCKRRTKRQCSSGSATSSVPVECASRHRSTHPGWTCARLRKPRTMAQTRHGSAPGSC
mmetsp:Transcript_92752/g.278262  ORF Transcript_92752/g.278262 Transcript_92752/m.278262 type:complete len:201 (+) Transcript_92752:904-1506(+)